jgi:hypothetical protein
MTTARSAASRGAKIRIVWGETVGRPAIGCGTPQPFSIAASWTFGGSTMCKLPSGSGCRWANSVPSKNASFGPRASWSDRNMPSAPLGGTQRWAVDDVGPPGHDFPRGLLLGEIRNLAELLLRICSRRAGDSSRPPRKGQQFSHRFVRFPDELYLCGARDYIWMVPVGNGAGDARGMVERSP